MPEFTTPLIEQVNPSIILSANSGATSTTTVVWPAWNEAYSATGGAGTAIGVEVVLDSTSSRSLIKVWRAWGIAKESTTTTTTTNEIWRSWGRIGNASPCVTTTLDPWIPWNMLSPRVALPLSDEDFRIRAAQNERARQTRLVEEGERAAARMRAQILLREHLSDEQKAELADKRYFSLSTIDSESGERRLYRIHQGRAGNVEQVDDNGKRLKRFCIHPSIYCPDEDTMLAQKLMLESREEDFLRIANHS